MAKTSVHPEGLCATRAHCDAGLLPTPLRRFAARARAFSLEASARPLRGLRRFDALHVHLGILGNVVALRLARAQKRQRTLTDVLAECASFNVMVVSDGFGTLPGTGHSQKRRFNEMSDPLTVVIPVMRMARFAPGENGSTRCPTDAESGQVQHTQKATIQRCVTRKGLSACSSLSSKLQETEVFPTPGKFNKSNNIR